MLSFFENAQFSSEMLSFLEFYLVKISVSENAQFFSSLSFFEMLKKAWITYKIK